MSDTEKRTNWNLPELISNKLLHETLKELDLPQIQDSDKNHFRWILGFSRNNYQLRFM